MNNKIQFSDDDFEDDDDTADMPTIEDCCPYCGAIWGMDELFRERCFSCGWVVGSLYEGDDDE